MNFYVEIPDQGHHMEKQNESVWFPGGITEQHDKSSPVSDKSPTAPSLLQQALSQNKGDSIKTWEA